MGILTRQQQFNLIQIAKASFVCQLRTRIPKELTTAQCILESDWLLHAPGNNPFGIKCEARHKECQTWTTTEYIGGQKVEIPQSFAKFDTLADAFADRAVFLTNPKGSYGKVWATYLLDKNVDTYMQGVAKIYATAPNYYLQLKQILAMEEVKEALAACVSS